MMTPCDRKQDKRMVDSSGDKIKRDSQDIGPGRCLGGGRGDSDGDLDFVPTKKKAAGRYASSL